MTASCNCRQFLIDHMAAQGIEVNASPWRPGMEMPGTYEPLNMRCPHGVKWHMEPTTDQIAAWTRDGVQ